MKLFVVIGQRKQRYAGQYGMEALAVMTEYDAEGNPDYLPGVEAEHAQGVEFEAVRTITIEVNEAKIREQLFPAREALPGTVLPAGKESAAD